MYKVSILVPLFRVEKYIERCARSLFEQSYPNIEFVFIDDCSPDKSVSILEKIMEEYPGVEEMSIIHRHNKNRGLAAARNSAIDIASGEFIIHVDSDDWLEPNAIQFLVNKQLETGADIVSGNAHMHLSDYVEDMHEPNYSNKNEMVLQQLQYTWDHVIWRRLIRKSLYLDNGIRCIEGCDMAEDRYQMALLSYCAESYSRVDEFVYNYEKRNESSIMAQCDKNAVLRKSYQYLTNWMGITEFFYGKEPMFYIEAAKQTIRYSFGVLKLTLKYGGHTCFQHIINIIDQLDRDFFPLIGWETTGVKGFLLHFYPYMKCHFFICRSIKYLKRLI